MSKKQRKIPSFSSGKQGWLLTFGGGGKGRREKGEGRLGALKISNQCTLIGLFRERLTGTMDLEIILTAKEKTLNNGAWLKSVEIHL